MITTPSKQSNFINLEDLDIAIRKIEGHKIDQNQNLKFLQNHAIKNPKEIDRFVVTDEKGYNIIKFDDILYIMAARSYVTFFLKGNKKLLASNTLSFYESILPSPLFFRIHKSYLVNVGHVVNIDTGRGGAVSLRNGQELPVAYRRKSRFIKKIKESIA